MGGLGSSSVSESEAVDGMNGLGAGLGLRESLLASSSLRLAVERKNQTIAL